MTIQDEAGFNATLAEQAYQRLRGSIILGEILPNEKLRMETLQSAFGFSNTPLREALNRLAGERLVIADNRRGFRASPVSRKDFIDLTDARLIVERGALESAIEHGDDKWVAHVREAFDRLQTSEDRLNAGRLPRDREWAETHKAYHMALFSGGRSRRLISACSEVFDLAERYRHLATRHRLSPRHSGHEHRAVLEAVLDRDSLLATALLRSHVQKSATQVLAMLEREHFKPGNADL